MTPFHQDQTVTLYHGHTLDVLRALPDCSVQCCVTSPPYWGLRDYGLPPVKWADGSECCFGLEPTPQLYIEHSVEIFREVRRVLRNDGTLWLNIGDSYNSGTSAARRPSKNHGGNGYGKNGYWTNEQIDHRVHYPELKPKDLCGLPWRVAIALQADGWYLRQDIIWHKPSPMPSSVTDRCTTAHEYLFLLSKSQRYYFDAEAIKEPAVYANSGRESRKRGTFNGKGAALPGREPFRAVTQTRNRRSVWTVATRPYKGAHFATFPPQLIEPCILAGTSEKGCCPGCGAPWKRVAERQTVRRERPNDRTARHSTDGQGPVNSCGNTVAGVNVITTGWEPSCKCVEAWGQYGFRAGRPYCFGPGGMPIPLDPAPCTVLDPFIGSGTTCMVSNWLGRKSIGIDQSETYLRDHALKRIATPKPKAKKEKRKCPKPEAGLFSSMAS